MSKTEAARELCLFSPEGSHLAISRMDGEVQVWEVASGRLKLRFSPGGARARPASCLSWSRQLEVHPHKHKKRKPLPSLLAVGVASKIIVWNISRGEEDQTLAPSSLDPRPFWLHEEGSGVHTRLPLMNVHSDVVNSVSWRPGNKALYSGSSDCLVAEWSVETGQCISKWKADKHAVQCVCCHSNSELLLSAGRNIKLWNLSDHTLIKKFTGHATHVRQMAFLNKSLFLSCAENDRVMNIWNAEMKSHDPTTLVCEEEVISFSSAVVESEQVLRVAALSDEGCVHLFTFPLTNQIKAPISARSTVQFVSTASQDNTPSPLPVLATRISSSELALAHTSTIRPTFETIDFDQSERRVCLVREAKGGLLLGQQKRRSAATAPSSKTVTVLGPGNMMLPSESPPKLTNHITEDVPMSDKLEAMADSSRGTERGQRTAPSADSLSRMLAQAVHSEDQKLMEEVLRVSKEKVVMASVRRLPVPCVIPFLKHLIGLLQLSPARGLELSNWVRAVLITHTAYLMTVPHLMDSLSGLYQLLDARVSTFPKLCRLQGRLDLLLSQVPPPSAEMSGGEREGGMLGLTAPLVTVTVGEREDHMDESPSLSEGEGEAWSSDSSDADTDQSESSSSDEAMETQSGELT